MALEIKQINNPKNPSHRKYIMIMNIAYNLADIGLYYREGTAYEQHLKDTRCSRFYIGSYFCGKYCLKSIHFFMPNLLTFFTENQFCVTFVIPTSPEHESVHLKQSIEYLLEYCGNCIDELVVNDYGMLEFAVQLQERYPIKITAGRLFSKNFRDPRYSAYEKETAYSFIPEILQKKVSAIEIDLVSENIDFSDLDSEIQIHAHYPYTYVTCGQNCEFAASIQPEGYRFIGGRGCGLSCMNGYMETSANDALFLLVGKGVYTKSNLSTNYVRKPDRFIYWPADEFLKPGNENENTNTI